MRGSPAIRLALAGLFLAGAPTAYAQDIPLLGRVYGTPVPRAYYERVREDPRAFQLERGFLGLLRDRGLGVREGIEGAAVAAAAGAAPVRGVVRIPIVLGLYSNSGAPPVPAAALQRDFFDGPSSYFGTLTAYYGEVSGGALTATGNVHEWVQVSLPRDSVVGRNHGLGNDARVGEYIVRILRFLTDSARVDWSRYDADGDGYVDVLGVMHPDKDGACGGPGIWSHRYSLRGQIGGDFVATLADGRQVRINDYVVVSAISCEFGRTVNEIGIFAHELGHAFGLPDLYDTVEGDGQHSGVGSWDLMATGAWGCSFPSSRDAARPCHPGAWSKAQVGWVAVDVLAAGGDHGTLRLGAVETGGRVLRVPSGDGSGEYFLLENREAIGFDEKLFAPGLLIWHIDAAVVSQRAASNTINTDPRRMGVALEQADGLNQLALLFGNGGNYGDAGDPFPGSANKTAFHAGTTPSSFTNQGKASGFTLLSLALAGTSTDFRALTRYQTLGIVVEGTSAAVMTVAGAAASAAPRAEFRMAPFETESVEAAAGAILAPGVRDGFLGWADGATRLRTFTMGLADTTLTARYGRREYLVDLKTDGPVPRVAPGTLAVTPAASDGWFEQGTEVTVAATPVTGFAFSEWTGDLAGAPNPVSFRVDRPRTASARFRLIFGVASLGPVVSFQAATAQEVVLRAENANEPVRWSQVAGQLPEGLALKAEGRITGAALETGSFPVTVRATDALGLEATAAVTFEVREPQIAGPVLAGPFLLNGMSPDALQQVFLDRIGNANGRYDLADLRAYVILNPNLPQAVASAVVQAAPLVLPLVDFSDDGRGPGSRR
ncbi:MAG: M6 family metalloprotease domain-containing protein [Gemmatimonadetes bacterium]|nr:M6 family metalloprotease domain-containing protein [Gemmatimonadota bacterium]